MQLPLPRTKYLISEWEFCLVLEELADVILLNAVNEYVLHAGNIQISKRRFIISCMKTWTEIPNKFWKRFMIMWNLRKGLINSEIVKIHFIVCTFSQYNILSSNQTLESVWIRICIFENQRILYYLPNFHLQRPLFLGKGYVQMLEQVYVPCRIQQQRLQHV